MTTSTEAAAGLDPGAGLRCSDYARSASLSPIGTSGSYAGYLLVEIPLPWPRDVGDTAEGAALGPLIGPLRYRLQAIAPAAPAADPRRRRVILHARRPGEAGFSGYRRFESLVGDSLADTAAALIAAAADDARSDLESPAVDVLVCTHGSRDSCCGRRGASLAVELAAAGVGAGLGAGVGAGLGAGENLLRTSHMGGHRFAPTFMVLPQGTVWGFADADLVARVVRQTGDFADVAARYRGCPGLDGPQVQALEVEVLRRVGWSLLGMARTASFDAGIAELTWTEGGRTVTWAGDVGPGRTVAAPPCLAPVGAVGAAAGAVGKSETEWAVTGVHRR
ncbi:MAG TPA: sucrase ferredoxin [Trebonia sp.]|jgi:hypothetical protein|nr:sucrase ferredoxin [Trebonia sp.]